LFALTRDVPITISASDAEAWGAHTGSALEVRVVPGGHPRAGLPALVLAAERYA